MARCCPLSPIIILFWTFFPLTALALVLALLSGLHRRRRRHLWLGPVSLVLLAVTILLAERMASLRQFPPDEMRVHLWFAKTGAFLAIPVVITGAVLFFRPRWRRAHFVTVILFLCAVVVATGTGLWVFSLSHPI